MGPTMDTAAREAMAEGALLALLFCFNSHHQSAAKADRVTVSLTIGDDGVVYTDASYWAGDVPLGGQGF